MSPADLADLRRQKTVRSNVSAKADAADNAEVAEKCSRAALFRRERHIVVNVVLGFRLRKSARSARDIGVSFVRID